MTQTVADPVAEAQRRSEQKKQAYLHAKAAAVRSHTEIDRQVKTLELPLDAPVLPDDLIFVRESIF